MNLDELFCYDLKNGLTDVKCNHIDNGVLHEADADSGQLAKGKNPLAIITESGSFLCPFHRFRI
jgi:hypothetical protein